MSESDKSKLVERVGRIFDSRLELVRFFLHNAAVKHGVPWSPSEPVTLDEKHVTEDRSKTIAPDKPQEGPLKKLVKRVAIPVALGATLGVGGPLVYKAITSKAPLAEKPTDGSLFQYLEDGGFHRLDA